MVDNDWGIADYPLVPGHEGVGIVSYAGPAVRGLKPGDRVGVGWIRDACGSCQACGCGRENLCESGYKGTYLGDSACGVWGKSPNNEFGCFSKVMRVEERFAFKLPDNVPTHLACPLMCAGGTVFEPIVEYVKPGTVVGIGAIGGLGTLAIKLAKLYGGRVVCFSGTPAKREAVLKAGADVFVDTHDPEQMKAAPKCNVFLETCPANREVGPLMDLLKFDGVYCRMGLPPANDAGFKWAWIPMIFTAKRIAGSIVTGSVRMAQLLQLASSNLDFVSDIGGREAELVPFAQVNEAMAQLKGQKQAAYRFVLTWESA